MSERVKHLIVWAVAVALAAFALIAFVSTSEVGATNSNTCQDQHYSWTGGPIDEEDTPPIPPDESWQKSTHQEPHRGNKVTWVDEAGVGLHYTGTPGNANWFYFDKCDPEPCPEVTVTAPGPTVTATVTAEPEPNVTETVTATATATETVMATATATVTATATATETVKATETIRATETATVTLPPVIVVKTATATATSPPVTATATETVYAEDGGLAKTGANLGTLGWASLLIALGTIIIAFASRLKRGAHQ